MTSPPSGSAADRVFEDFRRDFARVPVAWRVDDDGGSPATGQELLRWISAQGHVLLDERDTDAGELPTLWFPTARVRLVGAGATTDAGRLGVGEADVCVSLRSDAPVRDIPATCGETAGAARARQVDALRGAAMRPSDPACDVSIVVCTYRRAGALSEALASLAAQTYPAERYEIVVINNDPADRGPRDVVAAARAAAFAGREDRLRLVQCPFPGLSFARNAGIGAARGAIVSFIDDDAVARPDWTERVVEVFADHPEAGVVGGSITLRLPEPRPRWAKPGWRKYWSECATELTGTRTAGHWWEYPWGANWSARRAVLLAMGGFRTRYGRRGADAAGGEEIVAAALARELGYAVLITPAAKVVHAPDPLRFTMGHVWRRIQAAKREEYWQQRDGYIGPAMTFGSIAWNVARELHRASRRGLAAYQRLEHLMYAVAEARLLPRLAWDRRGSAS